MIGDVQRTLAVWAVLVVPFGIMVAYLWSREDFGVRFVVAYWFPAVVLTVVGVLPPPWQEFAG